MLRRLGLLFAALALFTMAGGHWAVLQGIAWAGMLRDCTQRTGSVAVAVEQTFDGEHPCELCVQIAFDKQQEAKAQDAKQKPDSSKSGLVKADKSEKAVSHSQDTSPIWLAAMHLCRIDQPDLRISSREDQPPTPPPRRPSCV